MARPIKVRVVDFFPDTDYFVPAGKQECKIVEKRIKVEELEAMRLKDIEKLSQAECAVKMGVSRQTFQNIIDSARKKVAIALTEGYAINISGGNYISKACVFKCKKCEKEYELIYDHEKYKCPECGSDDIHCSVKGQICKSFCLNNIKDKKKRG